MTIASHALEILRQGVWASLTGGWCYDPRQSLACNVAHMYLWLFLFALPLLIVLCFDLTWIVISAYASIICVLFGVLKISNYYLHTIFDTHEPIDVVVASNAENDGDEARPNEAVVNLEEGLGLNVVEENTSEDAGGNRSRIQSEARAPTFYDVIPDFPYDDGEEEEEQYAACGDPASSETAITALDDDDQASARDDGDPCHRFVAHHRRRRAVIFKKPRERRSVAGTTMTTRDSCSKQFTADLGHVSPTGFLAVEADVHSMPNELSSSKDDVIDIENIELRTVRSDSKLIPSTGSGGRPTTSGQGCSVLTTTADVTVEREKGNDDVSGGTSALVLTTSDTPGTTSKGEDSIDEEQEQSIDEEEEDGLDDEEAVEEGREDEMTGTNSSSTVGGSFTRKYSEPLFSVDSVMDSSEMKADDDNTDGFGRIVKRPSGVKRGVATTAVVDGNAVRRTRSTMETCAQRRTGGRYQNDSMDAGVSSTSSTLLSETCLEKCRGKGVRKSYPGKTSSTDIFLLQHVGTQNEQERKAARRVDRGSNSIGSSGTGFNGSSVLGESDGQGAGSQTISRDDDETGPNTLWMGRVTRFLSVDVPLTEVPERDSESERPEGLVDLDIPAPNSSVLDRSDPAEQHAPGRSDPDYGMSSSFYATASEGSAAPSDTAEHSNTRRRRWASSDDPPVHSPKTRLIQNLRDTLETLKSETPTTGSSINTATGETDQFVAGLQALKDASTPDLRWLFDDAAAVLSVSSSFHHSPPPPIIPSPGNSPAARPRLASLHGQQLALPSSTSRESNQQRSPSLQNTYYRLCSPARRPDVTLIQHQFRERLMEEIKRLLGEIIDSHPEALEAIESVRQAKLARIAERASGSAEMQQRVDHVVDYDDEDEEHGGPSHRRGPSGRGTDDDGASPGNDGDRTDTAKSPAGTSHSLRRPGSAAASATGAISSSADLDEGDYTLALSELAKRRNIHVARSHEDTSEGAVHYFQDSDGQWYTYTFNAEGVATAQLLASDVALMNLIAQQQEESEARKLGQRRKRGRAKSGPAARSTGDRRDHRVGDGAMESAGGNQRQQQQQQSRSACGGGVVSQRQGRVAPPPPFKRIVLSRTGSSSSEESFLELDAPASIMHVGRSGPTTAGGAATSSLNVNRGAMGSITAAEARVALPIRLRQHSSGGGDGPTGGSATSAPVAGGRRRRSGAGGGGSSFVPLRHMLNRSGASTSGQFLSSGATTAMSAVPRCRSGSLSNGREVGAGGTSFITASAHQNDDDPTTPGEFSTIGVSSSNFLAFSGSLRTPSDLSRSSFRARFFATLPSMIEAAHIGATNAHGGKLASGVGSSAKRKQYYRVSLCPLFGASSCCPKWLASRLRIFKFWTSSGGNADDGESKGSGGGVNGGWICCPAKTFKLSLDRLRLLAVFDRNKTKFSALVDVLLAVLVAVVACGVLGRPIFYDLALVLACFVTAGAQFSLMKSVQPDASSPVHGYNALVAYSRPVYYCIFGILLYAIDRFLAYHPSNPYATETLYSSWPEKLECCWSSMKNFFAGLFLFLPVVFTFGLLPQLNTFAIYILEQVEMLVFGGTASVGLASAFFSVFRSIACSGLLFTLNYFAAQSHPDRPNQNVVFSSFCGLAVSISYVLSRSSSDPRLLGTVLSAWRSRSASSSSSSAVVEKTPSREPLQGGVNGEGNDGMKEEEFYDQSLFPSDLTISSSAMTGRHRHHHKQRQLSLLSAQDPLPGQIGDTILVRLQHDFLVAFVLAIIYFALHCSTAIVVLKAAPLEYILPVLAVTVGFVCHYFLPQMRQHTPWKILATPVLKTHEHRMYDVDSMAKLMVFERLYAILNLLERNVLYPILIIYLVTACGEEIWARYGIPAGSVVITIASMKLLRTGFCNAAQLYLPLGAAALLGYVDYPSLSFTMLIDFYLLALIYPKFIELVLKLQFIFSYVAPWQISWGSAFHAFAQPTSIPHSAFTLAIAAISSVFSAPLNPFLGSAVFLASYVRPVKFWEKNYNTKRIDNSNTRLISQIDRGPMTDDSNLNAIFYEHLTRSLQRSLAGDLQLGRLATPVSAGDCFILASFYLNCLVHVIEVGNGFVTFQLRGLEFRGTYCQQREVEAISEEVADQGCCCCGGDGGGTNNGCCMRGFLSFNAVWNLSWLSWRVTAAKFVLEGYSVSDNSALSLLQLIELRRLLVTLYVKCIIFYAVKSSKLEEWLCTESIASTLEPIMKDQKYVDVDPSFCATNDGDYDCNLSGISRQAFCQQYHSWIEYCNTRRGLKQTSRSGDNNKETIPCDKDSPLTAFCYAMTLVGRRVLGAAAQGRHTTGAESFVYGLHALFKGDFRITCSRDEWIFADMDILKSVIAPAVRMALKLHQDHFTVPDDFESMLYLYGMIDLYDRSIFISHENDPAWRHAVLNNTRNLLALRHVFEDGQDDFKIIMLNRRHMSFRVIALNKECVRAFWSGQQQELIFLRNRNPERGSIQNARQVLRNMINSSADQPIGYPIYVSPLTTSFCETHEQVSECIGPPLTMRTIGSWCSDLWRCCLRRCGISGSSSLPPLTPASSNIVSPPASGFVHFGLPPASRDARMAETSLMTGGGGRGGGNGDRRRPHTISSRHIPRPRTSLVNPPPPPRVPPRIRREDRSRSGGERISATVLQAAGMLQEFPMPESPLQDFRHPPHRHGSAPPVMQRSLTHPLRAASLISQMHRQRRSDQQQPPQSPRATIRATACGLRYMLATATERSPGTVPRNSVVSTRSGGGGSSSADAARVSLGSLLALNVQQQEGLTLTAASSSATRERRGERVRIVDPSMVLDDMDTASGDGGERQRFLWPREEWRRTGGRMSWKKWRPEQGMEGSVVHRWNSLSSTNKRGSAADKVIVLVSIMDGKYYVPIYEEGVQWIGDEL